MSYSYVYRSCNTGIKYFVPNKPHVEECLYGLVKCDQCSENVMKLDMPAHQQEVCVKRIVQCPYCHQPFQYDACLQHKLDCPNKPKMCPFNCGESLEDVDYQNHLLKCSKIINGEVCVFKNIGCDFKGESSIVDHQVEKHNQHDVLITTSIELIRNNNMVLQQNVSESLLKILKVEDKSESYHQVILNQHEKIESLEKKVERLSTKVEHLSNNADKKEKNHQRQMILVLEKITTLERKIIDLEKKTNESAAEEIKGCNQKIDRIDDSQTQLNTTLSDLDLRQQLLENTCYDGRMLWKIDKLVFRMQQAKDGKVTALHSAPCFTKKYGYKFCTRLYLNGDGIGKNSHVSLFFVVMKSECDALLEWPFRERVTFKLLNVTDLREPGVKETFLPDRNSSSFQKPVREMNVAAGSPTFISLEELMSGKYVVEDSIFIETCVG